MKNIRKIAVGMGVAALLVVGWVAPQISAEPVAPTGCTVVDTGGSCELATLDLTTGPHRASRHRVDERLSRSWSSRGP